MHVISLADCSDALPKLRSNLQTPRYSLPRHDSLSVTPTGHEPEPLDPARTLDEATAAPSTRREELRSFLFFTVVMAPVLAVLLVASYGFAV